MNAIAFKCIFSQYDQKSFSRLFIVILLHSVVEYSLNQFPCTDMFFFLWKPWINKSVTLCNQDHFQFEFHLISQIYHSIDPEHFSGETCLEKKSKNWFQSIFKSLNAIVSFYTDKLFTQDFPRVFPRRTYISVQGCFFFCEEITLSALKVWNEFNKCGK